MTEVGAGSHALSDGGSTEKLGSVCWSTSWSVRLIEFAQMALVMKSYSFPKILRGVSVGTITLHVMNTYTPGPP